MSNRTLNVSVLFLVALSFSILIGVRRASAQQAGTTQVLAHLGASSAAPDPETFIQFSRYPVEVQNFIQMTGTPPTAYYRDEFVGGETLTTGANDGDAIYAQLFDANGNLLSTWSSFVFYASYPYNGQTLQNCWVAPGIQPLCGSNSTCSGITSHSAATAASACSSISMALPLLRPHFLLRFCRRSKRVEYPITAR